MAKRKALDSLPCKMASLIAASKSKSSASLGVPIRFAMKASEASPRPTATADDEEDEEEAPPSASAIVPEPAIVCDNERLTCTGEGVSVVFVGRWWWEREVDRSTISVKGMSRPLGLCGGIASTHL